MFVEKLTDIFLVFVDTFLFFLLCLLAVDFVCDEPRIRAISFVGSDYVGKYIYERGTANGKRVQSNMVQRNGKINDWNYSYINFDRVLRTMVSYCLMLIKNTLSIRLVNHMTVTWQSYDTNISW